jgi:hypothetical protein
MSKKIHNVRGTYSVWHHEETEERWRATITPFVTINDDAVLRIGIDDCEEEAPQPPKWAEFFLTALACSPHAEAAIGDLNEQFAGESEQFGATRAGRLYWARTARSIVPLLLRAAGKALKWGAVIATVKRLF